ncbi:MAG: signal peptidase II, partial [Gemmatimonadales bacterium]|nr:signal peptidase II [Gemmatimonadales bacterium]
MAEPSVEEATPAAAGPDAASAAEKPFWRWLLLSLVVIGLDQASKWAILGRFEYGERLNLIPGWFDFTLVYNTGAAFSFLAGAAGWQRWFFT